ncbi:MAG: NADH-quinone oxidoreductase subunit C, partial [Stellaceae bacterium]
MEQQLTALAEHLAAALPDAVEGSEIRHGELCVQVERAALAQVLRFLRDNPKCRFTILCDICGVDYPDRARRFDVVYNLLSMSLNQRIRLKVETYESEPVPSATDLYSSAGWWEREAWDLYGIY